MKKLIIMCLLFALLFTLIGCNEKDSGQWCDYLNKEVSCYELNVLAPVGEIQVFDFVKNYESVVWEIDDKDDINKIIDIIDVPYIDLLEVQESTDSVYNLLFSGATNRYSFGNQFNEGEAFHICVYSTGYISLSVTGETYEKNYVSLEKVDFEALENLCDRIIMKELDVDSFRELFVVDCVVLTENMDSENELTVEDKPEIDTILSLLHLEQQVFIGGEFKKASDLMQKYDNHIKIEITALSENSRDYSCYYVTENGILYQQVGTFVRHTNEGAISYIELMNYLSDYEE